MIGFRRSCAIAKATQLKRLAGLATLTLVVTAELLGQEPPTSDCSHPVVLLNALDRNFAVKRDLRADNLKVEVGRKPARVVSLSLDSHPRQIVLMVDTSGSMVASPWKSGWGITLPTAALAADLVPTSGSVALVTFSDQLLRESNGFESRELVGARVLDLAKRQPKGDTALLNSIHQVLSLFGELHFGDVIYLVTDGGDNKSKISLPKLEEELIARGVRLFVFLVDRDGPLTEANMNGPPLMDSLAEATGGSVVRITSAEIRENERVAKLAPQVIGQVESVYKIELAISGPADKATPVKLAFVGPSRSNHASSIAYQRQIVPCLRKP